MSLWKDTMAEEIPVCWHDVFLCIMSALMSLSSSNFPIVGLTLPRRICFAVLTLILILLLFWEEYAEDNLQLTIYFLRKLT